ncbi:MAG: class I SAM-dependent methyltransferase [Pseudonocardiaceae bacterium]
MTSLSTDTVNSTESDNGVDPQARFYTMGRNDAETRRLRMQGVLYAEATRTLLLRAGLRAGLDVLDVGCGAGDVALAVADIVGPHGTVTAVDNDPQILKVAGERAAAAGAHNVTFTVGDVHDLRTDARFDAVVGRLILMHVADPTATLARLATLLRPGGTIAMQDFALSRARTIPPGPYFEGAIGWIIDAVAAVGARPDAGDHLYRWFREAGFDEVNVFAVTPGGGDVDGLPLEVVAATVSSLAPLLTAHGLAAAEETQIDRVRQNLVAEAKENSSVVFSPELVGVWTTLR